MTDDWIAEDQAPGVRLSLRVRNRIFSVQTPYQHLEIADTEALGRVLLLDGRIMVTERDEAFYHEMLVHPALLRHPAPRRVVVVGGGDGGAVREALRHPVEEVTLVEIDREVVAACRDHLPGLARGAWDDPRVRIVISPAEAFLPGVPEAFDALIVDSTDPIGPGAALFSPEFLAACRRALRPGGVAAFQAGSPFYAPEVLRGLVAHLRAQFRTVAPYLGFVPSYPSGLWAYVLASDGPAEAAGEVAARFRARGLATRYYTPRLDGGAFALPAFVEELLAEGR
ncbi:MAG: polyamine aminopropyltransferase [Candidatus Bipolaricaulota bacterium]|nr:polyamine aminopropyltransferase [Candidatus Bipolaricaulota bacterium]